MNRKYGHYYRKCKPIELQVVIVWLLEYNPLPSIIYTNSVVTHDLIISPIFFLIYTTSWISESVDAFCIKCFRHVVPQDFLIKFLFLIWRLMNNLINEDESQRKTCPRIFVMNKNIIFLFYYSHNEYFMSFSSDY